MENKILQSYLRGDTKIDLSQPDDRPLSERMLTFPWRDYVINRVKAPLRRRIIKAKRLFEIVSSIIEASNKIRSKFGSITNTQVVNQNTHCLIEHKEKFISFESNPDRINLLEAAYDILIAENAHDYYYSDRFQVELEFIIQDILAGKWQPRLEGRPDQYWNETKPYGGKYSIVYKLQKHREEILKIINE